MRKEKQGVGVCGVNAAAMHGGICFTVARMSQSGNPQFSLEKRRVKNVVFFGISNVFNGLALRKPRVFPAGIA
jgi:hypothetical protein